MRIGIIADPIDNQNAGVHVYTLEMILALVANDRVNEYIIIRQKAANEIKKEYTNVKQIVISNIALPIGYASFRLFFIIPYILKKEKVDVVIEPAHFGPFNLPKHIKRITIIHDLSAVLFPQWHRWHSGVLQKLFLPRILKKSDYILSNSYTTEKELHRFYPFTINKTWMIYPGIKKLVNVIHEKEFNQKYQLTKQDYFLFVGTLEPRKNLALLLDAFEIYKTSNKDQTQLIIAGGKGWKNEAFEQRLAQHPNKNEIIITGYISNEELSFLYRNAIALIYPSQYEGFGFPVIEAMSVGTAVITTTDTSMDEISKPLALTFTNNDKQDLSKKMLEIKQLNTNYLDKKKREDFTIKYDWNVFAKALLIKLSEILK